jgi:hypothetical protein
MLTHRSQLKVRRIFLLLFLLIGITSLPANAIAGAQKALRQSPNAADLPYTAYLPFITLILPSPEWTQHAHDAQHTGYTSEVVETPWRWK